jgi:hypothetical protein
MRELITIKGTQRACLYGLGVLGLLDPSPPAKSKSKLLLQLLLLLLLLLIIIISMEQGTSMVMKVFILSHYKFMTRKLYK